MKRSEMLEDIAEKLLTTIGLFGGAEDEWEEVRKETKMYRLKLAHNALKAAEESGMLPPPTNRGFAMVNRWDNEEFDIPDSDEETIGDENET